MPFERLPVGAQRQEPRPARKAGRRIPVSALRDRLRGAGWKNAALAGAGCLLLGWAVFYGKYIAGLPDIRGIEDARLQESSVFYDRNGQELYRSFASEKRQYVAYGDISENMVRAIVSAEDKTFFSNPGVDLSGLARAVGKFLIGKDDRVRGTSTISQQLMKMWYLSNDRSLDRKIKEAYLSWKLNQTYSKEKILELYLNKIGFGSNAFGVEQASRTFFGKGAKDLGVLGASILASLPKGPTYYSPYSHRDRLMGYLYAVPADGGADAPQTQADPSKPDWAPFVAEFERFASGVTMEAAGSEARVCGLKPELFKKALSIDSDGCRDVAYGDLLSFWNSVSVKYGSLPQAARDAAAKDPAKLEKWKSVSFEYQTGRKDFVLGRMFEDGAIDGKQYMAAFLGGLRFTFKPYREEIVAPHFVFHVKDLLAKKYGEDFFSRGGMKIYTTIDIRLQKKAQEIVAAKARENAVRASASGAALVALENETGKILAMVGSSDYFDESSDGQVNVVTSKRQPGSSFKPLVYALAMANSPVGPESPVYDVPTKFGDWDPKNFDGNFMGKMTLRTALDQSRNIPAAKMFYLAGGEGPVVKFARDAGVKSLNEDGNYGAPLSIGTGEAKPIEMAEAYMTLANLGVHKDVSAVEKVVDADGNVIEEWQKPAETRVLPESAAWLVWKILSDPSGRPADWNGFLLPKDGRPVAVKTGTSNMEVGADRKGAVSVKGEDGTRRILPRDLWTDGFTPQITAVAWAGNADGSPVTTRGDGLQSAGPIFRDFMAFAHADKPALSLPKPDSVESARISSLNGKLAGPGTPADLAVQGDFAAGMVPADADGTGDESREVDALCGGPVTADTPAAAIRRGKVLDMDSMAEHGHPEWQDSLRDWAGKPENKDKLGSLGEAVFGSSAEPCARPAAGTAPTVRADVRDKTVYALSNNRVPVSWTSGTADGNSLEILLDGRVAARYALPSGMGGSFTGTVDFPQWADGPYAMTVRVMDRWYRSSEANFLVAVMERDVVPPKIVLTRPDAAGDRNLNVYPTQSTMVRARIEEAGVIRSVNLYVDGKLSKILGDVREVAEEVNAAHDFPVGTHEIRLEAIDGAFNKSSEAFTVTVLPR